MEQALEGYSPRPVVEGLMALRGVDRLVAMTVVVELGDLTRLDSPRQLMAYLGLVPSEHSSGGSRRQGGITKTGTGPENPRGPYEAPPTGDEPRS